MGGTNQQNPVDILVKYLNAIYDILKGQPFKNDMNEIKITLKAINDNLIKLNQKLENNQSSFSLSATSANLNISSDILNKPLSLLEDEKNDIVKDELVKLPLSELEDKKVINIEFGPAAIKEEVIEKVKEIKEKIAKKEIKLPEVISEEDKKKVQLQVKERLEESERLAQQVREQKKQNALNKFPALKPPAWFEDEETKKMKLPPLPPPT